MGECTEFCASLKAMQPKNGVLPSHGELAAELHFTAEDDQQMGRSLGTWKDLLERRQCGFCELVVAAISSGCAGLGGDQNAEHVSPDQEIKVLLFPDEQAFRLSHPSRLGVRLAFVSRDDEQSEGPDTARLIDGSRIQVSRILKWLQACGESHKCCLPETVELVCN